MVASSVDFPRTKEPLGQLGLGAAWVPFSVFGAVLRAAICRNTPLCAGP